MDKKPRPINLKLYPGVHDEYAPTVASISTATDSPTGIVSTPGTIGTQWPGTDSTPIPGNVDGSQSTRIAISPEAHSFPRVSPPSYVVVADNGGKSSISPIAIIGLATGGAIAAVVALTMVILMCTRQRRSGRYRQGSITGQESPIDITAAPSYRIGSNVSKDQERLLQELTSSLKTSPSNRAGSSRSRHSKHITWKDQVFSDQSFITLPPLPPHPTSLTLPSLPRNCLCIGREAQEVDTGDHALYLSPQLDSRVSYRSFSTPILGGDCASIRSSVPSPVFVSALSPIPSFLFPAPNHQLQRSQVPSSHYSSLISSSTELNDSYATITCASIYTFLPAGGRRSLSDSFVIHEANSSAIIRQSSVRYSGNIQTFHPSPAYQRSPALLPQLRYYASQKPASRNRFSSFIVTEDIDNDGDSISSVSSTGSSILDYSARSTPRKPPTGGVLTVGSSSPYSFDHSPPSGGLTSPCHRTRPTKGDLTIKATSPMSGHTLDDLDSPQTPGPRSGTILSPHLSGVTFISSASKQVLHDIFLDAPDIGTRSPTPEDISTRHFSCSMPTRPKYVGTNSLPPPYPQVIPPTPTRPTIIPDSWECDSPTLPRDPATETRAFIYSNTKTPPVNLSRRMHGGIESTYSPTLSMVNFYTMESRVDSCFPPLPPGPTSAPYHSRSSSVPPRTSKNQSQYEGWRRESLIEEYHQNSTEQIPGPVLLSPSPIGRGLRVGESAIDGSVARKRRRCSSRLSSTADGYMMTDKRIAGRTKYKERGGDESKGEGQQ